MSIKQQRQTLRARRKQITDELRHRLSEKIRDHLSSYPPFCEAENIAFYAATTEEVDSGPSITMASGLGKSLYLPVINTVDPELGRMLFAPFDPIRTRMGDGPFGIPEPLIELNQCISGKALDLVCVPLVGFNRRCDRIGMGKGYYDEAFSPSGQGQPVLVGLAYDCQEAEFEAQPHDVPLHAVITESGIVERTAG